MTCRAASVAVSASFKALSAAVRVEVNCRREGAVEARCRCLALTLAAIALNKPCIQTDPALQSLVHAISCPKYVTSPGIRPSSAHQTATLHSLAARLDRVTYRHVWSACITSTAHEDSGNRQ